MWDNATTVGVGIIVMIISILPPSFHYIRLSRISGDGGTIATAPENFPNITLIIPARDESALITTKLENVISLDYPIDKMKILIVDSNSIDDTSEKATNFLNKYCLSKWDILRVPVPGKSIAVNRAIDYVDTDFFILTDVDSILPTDSLKDIMSEFLRSERIGAVCGSISTKLLTKTKEYRKRFNLIRYKESLIHSTPIFEGSICAFRSRAVGESRINEDINADDSQLALICVRSGYRSIFSKQVIFTDSARSSIYSNERSVRRAQGLVRVFVSNLDLAFRSDNFRGIFVHNFYFYVIMPWVFTVGLFLCGPSALVYSYQIDAILFAIVLFSSIIIYSYSRLVKGFLSGIVIILKAQILYLFGKNLSVWIPKR